MRTKNLPSIKEWQESVYFVTGYCTTEAEIYRFLDVVFSSPVTPRVFVPENPDMVVEFTRLNTGEEEKRMIADGIAIVGTPEAIVLHHDVPGLEKGKEYRVGRVEHDVNGKWDGYRTWLVPYFDLATKTSKLILYIAIGDYWEVGSWPDDECAHSRFGVARRVADLMARGISPDTIWEALDEMVGTTK